MVEIGQYRYNLICVSKGSNEWTNRVSVSEIIQEVQLVQYSVGAAGDIYLLDSNIFRLSPLMTIILELLEL